MRGDLNARLSLHLCKCVVTYVYNGPFKLPNSYQIIYHSVIVEYNRDKLHVLSFSVATCMHQKCMNIDTYERCFIQFTRNVIS